MNNPAPNLAILAGNLQPRNIDSIVTVRVLGSTIVGTLESYSIMPDGKSMNLRLRGVEAVDVPSNMTIELSRSSDFNSRIARSLATEEILARLLNTINEMSEVVHDIADVIDPEVPDNIASLELAPKPVPTPALLAV